MEYVGGETDNVRLGHFFFSFLVDEINLRKVYDTVFGNKNDSRNTTQKLCFNAITLNLWRKLTKIIAFVFFFSSHSIKIFLH